MMIRAEVKLNGDEVKALIEGHYDLDVLSVKKVRAIYKAETTRGAFGFKNAEELPDLPFVAGCLSEIKNRGFQWIPDTIPAKNGDFLIQHGGESYFMEEWIEATEVPKQSYPYMGRIGTILADFHRAAGGIIPLQGTPRYEWGTHKSFLLQAYQNLLVWKQLPGKPGVELLERQILDFLFYRCMLAYKFIRGVSFDVLKTVLPESAVLCHGGLHHKNIMLDHTNQLWLIDFETMVYTERVMDLAQFLQYHASSYHWDPKVTYTFLSSYSSRLDRPIHRDEWHTFFSYLAFPRRFNNRMLRYFDNTDRPIEHLMKLKETVDNEASKEPFLKAAQF